MKGFITEKSEYPNPAFIRDDIEILDGIWRFTFDDANQMEKGGINNINFSANINVPFCYQSQLSGISTDETHENMWYNRTFTVTKEQLDGEVLLHFGAVDFRAKVWVNDQFVGQHEGGNTPFMFEIADFLSVGENQITIKAEDSYSKEQPRGKQMWGKDVMMCWYTNTSGIWQSVWLEFTGRNYIKSIRITPDIDNNQARFVIRVKNETNISLKVVLNKENECLGEMMVTPHDGKAELPIYLIVARCRKKIKFFIDCEWTIWDFTWGIQFFRKVALYNLKLCNKHLGIACDVCDVIDASLRDKNNLTHQERNGHLWLILACRKIKIRLPVLHKNKTMFLSTFFIGVLKIFRSDNSKKIKTVHDKIIVVLLHTKSLPLLSFYFKKKLMSIA